MDKQKCFYDYANKCDCSEDDKCGCTFPNNLNHDFDCDFSDDPAFLQEQPLEKFPKSEIIFENAIGTPLINQETYQEDEPHA